jgi:transcriptional regulator with XRE-family HTH domain
MPKRKPVPLHQAQNFGQRLAALRTRAGFTQRELAAQLGISQRVVAYYEKQTAYAPTQLLEPLSEVLGVSADEMLGLQRPKAERASSNQRLWRRFRQVELLPPRERKELFSVIDAFIDRHRLAQARDRAA